MFDSKYSNQQSSSFFMGASQDNGTYRYANKKVIHIQKPIDSKILSPMPKK